MRRGLITLVLCSLPLGGCNLIKMMMPSKPTTSEAARNAMKQCGIAPDSIAWRVTKDGAFAFGKKSPDAEFPSQAQSECLLKWAQENRVKVGFIGWESDPS